MTFLLGLSGFPPPTPSAYQDAVLDDAPIVWWRMTNPGSNTTEPDVSGHGHDGTHSPTTVASPPPDPADARFAAASHSDQYESIVWRSQSFAGPVTAMSVECWLRYVGAYPSNGIELVSLKWYQMAGGWALFADPAGIIKFMWNHVPGGHKTCQTPSVGWNDGYWHHIVATYDGVTARVYWDGAISGTLSYADPDPFCGTQTNLRAGYTSESGVTRHMTEVAVYDYALTPDRVAAHYYAMRDPYWHQVIKYKPVGFWRPRNPVHSGTDPDLAVKNANQITYVGTSASSLESAVASTNNKVAIWRMNSVGSTTATDSSGNGKHGTWAVTSVQGDQSVVPGYISTKFPDTDDQYLERNELLVSATMSFMAVVRPTLLDDAKHLIWCGQTAAGDGFGDENEFHVSLQPSGEVVLIVRTSSGNHSFQTSGAGITAGRTSVVIVTMTTGSGNVKIYVDGILRCTGTLSAAPNFTGWNALTRIGRAYTGSARYFRGDMGHVGIWSGVLTESEVASLSAYARQEISDKGFGDRDAFGVMRATMTSQPRASLSANPVGASTSQVSVSCWFRASVHKSWFNLVHNGWGSAGGWIIHTTSSGQIFFGVTDMSSTMRSVGGVITHNDSVWRHVVGTYDGTWMRLYVNGTQVAASDSYPGITLKTNASWGFVSNGSSTPTNWGPLQVQDPAVFDTALSAAQVAALYESGLGMFAGVNGSSQIDALIDYIPQQVVVSLEGDSTIVVTLVEDESRLPSGVRVDDLFRMGAIGNGRILVTGYVERDGTDLSAVQWRASANGHWSDGHGPVVAGKKFWLWVHGDHPAPWSSASEVLSGWAYSNGVYTVPAWRPVIRLWDRSQVIKRATSLADCQNTPGTWWWELGVLHYHPASGVTPSEQTLAVYDAVFARGHDYRIQVRVVRADTGAAKIVLDNRYTWPYEANNLVDHMIGVTSPSVLRDGMRIRGIYTAIAKMLGDLVATSEDAAYQTFVDNATWSVPIWERQMGIASNPSLPLDQRRDHLVARFRQRGGSREAFFALLKNLVGGLSVTDNYPAYRVDIRLPSVNTGARQRAEALIRDVKPVGIQVVVNQSAFIAGVSKAGDSL